VKAALITGTSPASLSDAGDDRHHELDEVEGCSHPDAAFVSYAPNVVATRMQEEVRGSDGSFFPRRERFVALAEADDLPRWSEHRDEA
jgi:hypothetical protein